MTNMTIEIKYKPIYGNMLAYPVNDVGKMALLLTGDKTFTERNMTILRNMGFTFFNTIF